MRDIGLVDAGEPFTRLLTQGMVLKDGVKMSKNLGNTVDPQELIDRFGADTVRLFTIFAAPPEQSLEWSDDAVLGASRFLKRLWKAASDHITAGPVQDLNITTLDAGQKDMRRQLHGTIAKVGDDMGRRYTFNTAIAAIMELMNSLQKFDATSDQSRAVVQEVLDAVVLLLSPIVPHASHALWHALGHENAVVDERWPEVDTDALAKDTVEIVVQVNGKLRGRVAVAADADKKSIEGAALADENVQRFIADKKVRRVIVVPGKLVNVVV